jgi:radical SAM protein with 4Fe4S-binding SPASM domain
MRPERRGLVYRIMSLQSHWTHLVESTRALLQPSPSTVPSGLYTYQLAVRGGRRRVHLRVKEDGTGVMFIDVTDVIHLNETAVEMVKAALDHVPEAKTEALLTRRYRGVRHAKLAEAIRAMYDLVGQLSSDDGACPTCALSNTLAFAPVFSTPITAPYKVDLALTYACNNACPHCYNETERLSMPSLSQADWFRVLDKLAEIGVPHVIFTGGEPTLVRALPHLIRYADSLGLIAGMNTNGRRLARPGFVHELVDAGLNHVQVTLESCYPNVHDEMVNAPGAFHETVQGIKNAIAGGLHTITNTTVTMDNRDHVLSTVSYLHELGLKTFAMNGMIHAGGGTASPSAVPPAKMAALLAAVRDEAETLGMRFLWYTVTDYCLLSPVSLDLPPKRCNAGEYSMCIEPNGDVLPCQSYYASAGNLLADPWDSIWNGALFRSFRDRETAPASMTGLPEECRECPDLELCGGGCRLEREARTGVRAAEHGCARARLRATGAPPCDASN